MARKKNTARPVSDDQPEVPEEETSGPLFENQAAQQAMIEDPLFVFLKNQWQNLLWGVVIVLVVLYGKNAFEQSKQANLERASDVYVRLKQEYEQFTAMEDINATAYKETQKRLQGYVSALRDEPSPYDQVATLYDSLLAAHSGDTDKVQNMLGSIKLSDIDVSNADQRLFAELSLLSLSRSLLDKEDAVQTGKATLYELATNGAFVRVAAALSFARVAKEVEEREKAAAVLEDIVRAQPEQAELVENELAVLKNT